jgi:hypothetical protein
MGLSGDSPKTSTSPMISARSRRTLWAPTVKRCRRHAVRRNGGPTRFAGACQIGSSGPPNADRDLALEAARHKSMFFAERAADRSPIDYAAAIGRGLRLCSRWRRPESSGARLCPYGRARPTVGRCRGLRGAHGAMRRYRGAGQPEGHMKGKDAGRGPVLRTREPHPRAMRGIAAGDHRRVSSASFAAALE